MGAMHYATIAPHYRLPLAPLPVTRIRFADRGQDFTAWYVRDGIVIDCVPFQGRVWVGTRLVSPVTLGCELSIRTRETGRELTLPYPVEAFETLAPGDADYAIEIGRNWAAMLGVPPSDLNL